ncbi:MAG: hypothetical protein LBK08_14180 [Treponema sp.]|jgi:predicted nucleic acid-binding protein|nr:hypothetical protein [Treponema sp.]
MVLYFDTIVNEETDKGNDFVIPPTLDIASTVKLKMRQQGKGISDDDLFIASYCLKHDMPLVTNNTRHFMDIDRATES